MKPDRSPESRQRVYAALERILTKNPDLRIGQLLSNALPHYIHGPAIDPYYIENNELAEYLEAWEKRP